MAETDDYLITVIKHRYTHRDSTCQLKMEIDWQSFKTNKGLFQGYPLSPILFKMYK